MSAPTALYRHFDADGQLLYIGVTNHPDRRLAEHKCRSSWGGIIASVNLIWFGDRASALVAEARAISAENPVHNSTRSIAETGDPLIDWMNKNHITQRDVAAKLGISQASFSRMSSGKNAISLRYAAAIEDWSEGEVPIRYWLFGVNTPAPQDQAAGLPSSAEGLRVVDVAPGTWVWFKRMVDDFNGGNVND